MFIFSFLKVEVIEKIMQSESIKKVGKKIILRSADRKSKGIFRKKTSNPNATRSKKTIGRDLS